MMHRLDTILSVEMKLNSHVAFTSPCLRHVDATCLPLCKAKGQLTRNVWTTIDPSNFGLISLDLRFLGP